MIELLLSAENALALGLPDQAERTFRQVLDADPRNGIAAVGLARVALERGDEDGALALARAALEIDPENATARRMIDRLDEVSRYRAAVAPPGEATPAVTPPREAVAPSSPAAAQPATAVTPPGVAVAPSGPAVAPSAPAGASAPPTHDKPASAATDATPAPPRLVTTSPPARRGPAPARPGLLRRLLRRS